MTDPRQDEDAGVPRETSAGGALPPLPPEENVGGDVSFGGGGPAALPPPPSLAAGASLPPVGGNKDLLGIASTIVGLLSLPVGGCCPLLCAPVGIVGLLGGVLGSVLGYMGMRKAAANGERSIIAIVGLCLSILAGVASVAWFLLYLLGFALGGIQ